MLIWDKHVRVWAIGLRTGRLGRLLADAAPKYALNKLATTIPPS